MPSIYSREYEVFRQLVRDVRDRGGLAQRELGAALDVDQATVSRIESGQRRLDFVETAAVCRACGVGLVEFVEEYERRLGS